MLCYYNSVVKIRNIQKEVMRKMCKTYENIKAMKNTIYGIENDKNKLTKALSNLDKAQQDLLHIIENEEKVNVVRMRDIYNSLRDVRIERRKVKNELEVINEIENVARHLKPQVVKFCERAERKEKALEDTVVNKRYNNKIMTTNADISKEINRIIEKGR